MEWPSRTQFEALANRVEGAEDETTAVKNRVTTLENRPVGEGSSATLYPVLQRLEVGDAAYVGVRVFEGDEPPVAEVRLKYVEYTLPVRQYAVSGVLVQVPAVFDHTAHPFEFGVGSEGTEYGVSLNAVLTAVETMGATKRLAYRFLNPKVLYGGFLHIHTPESGNSAYVLPVFDLTASPVSPPGVTVKTWGSVSGSAPEEHLGHGFGLDLLYAGQEYEVGGVLHPRQFPVFGAPTPNNPGQNAQQGNGLETGVEVVWPAGGTPYLHVYRRATYGNAGEHYHLPLTPGLPQ